VDPVMYGAAKRIGSLPEITPRKPREYFASLCVAIINQQLSNKAADSIEKRFTELFPRKRILPKPMLQLSGESLRNTGISWSKVRFMKDLAEKVDRRGVALSKLRHLGDEEVIQELTKVKGIGRWTAEMFLMFALGRPDIFSFGDLGLQKAIEKLYRLSDPAREELETITLKWSPYRTFASRVLWESVDN